jgi:hypothetical protein
VTSLVTAVVTIGTVCALGVFGNHSFPGSGGSRPSDSLVLRLAGAEVALPPSQLPQRLGIGVAAGPSDIGGWVAHTNIPFDYVYQYLAGGAGTSSDWTTWNANATFPLDYAQAAAAAHHVPVFSYYQLLDSGSCGGCGEGQHDLTNLNSASTMAAYFADFATLMQRLGPHTYGGVAGFGGTAVVQVEPDLSAYVEQAAIDNGLCYGFCTGDGNNPDDVEAAVASSGDPDVAGYANSYHGFVLALAHLRDLYAPNVLLGYHVSNWASLTDIGSSTNPSLDVIGAADTVASFTEASGVSHYDLVFNDVLDRDAGFYETFDHTDVWWDRDNVTFPNFHRWETYVGTILASVDKPGVVWQIPVGNQYFDTENNSWDHTQDNRVEYFFAHPTELTSIGIVALLFGPGNAGSTSFTDADNDGVKDFAPFCTTYGVSSGTICDNHPAVSSDDDGGYLRMVSAAYYQNPIRLIAPVPTIRIAGADRVATAVAASEWAFPQPGSGSAVVLSRSDQFADALAGTPLAVAKHGPLLLTGSAALDPRALAEIRRVLPPGGPVYLLGGPVALAPAVASALQDLGYQVTRLAGADRFATAVAVADQGLANPSTVFEATGLDFPDALSAAVAAAGQHAAVLLTDGPVQDPATAGYLASHTADLRVAVGGPAVTADPGAKPVAGSDRYSTSVALAKAYGRVGTVVGVASGLAFPDALAGGAALAEQELPLILVPEAEPPPASVESYLASDRPPSLICFGGSAAISDLALDGAAEAAAD